MDWNERLRAQKSLKHRNQARLRQVSAGSSELEFPEADSGAALNVAPNPETIRRDLERVRAKTRSSTGVSGRLRNLNWAEVFPENTIRTNSKGSFVHLVHEVSLPHGLLAQGSETATSSIRRLCELLTRQIPECDLSQVAFLDTETTGLSGGAGTYAFLVGVGGWRAEGSAFRIEQYFMRDYHEEGAMLLALAERLSGVRVLVTFNGKSFDVPVLQSRFVLARRRWPLNDTSHLDLLHPARRLWKLRLGDCSLGNLETRLLQRKRDLDVPGSEIPQLYFNYTRTRNPAGLPEILHHNRLDIETLAELTLCVSQRLGGSQSLELPLEDLFSAGKYLRALGQLPLATVCAESVLNLGPESPVRLETMGMLAALLKSQGRFPEAASLWRRVLEESSEFSEAACEELAIYHEHRERELDVALDLTHLALNHVQSVANREKWEHRYRRLLRKAGKQAASL
jgi:hypothetical protein